MFIKNYLKLFLLLFVHEFLINLVNAGETPLCYSECYETGVIECDKDGHVEEYDSCISECDTKDQFSCYKVCNNEFAKYSEEINNCLTGE
ncbi:hypothetical protein U3516DRAFT_196409 [Neocallimastix sp. 'constans']